MVLPEALRFTTIVLISAVAGAMNAIAGGGTLLTFPALVGLGIPPIVANATSTVALWPGTLSSMWGYRGELSGARQWAIGFAAPSLLGGGIGAWLLLRTPPSRFAALVPWLVLFATAVFFWGSFIRKTVEGAPPLVGPRVAAAAQFLIAIYGGYFGGGIGFLMLAVLTIAGLPVRNASAGKNVLAVAMNFSAVAIFVFSRDVRWLHAAVLGSGGILGGIAGAALLPRVNEQWLRIGVIVLGIALTAGLFLRGNH